LTIQGAQVVRDPKKVGNTCSSAIGREAMALVRQPKTAGFRPKSSYDIFVCRLSKCQ